LKGLICGFGLWIVESPEMAIDGPYPGILLNKQQKRRFSYETRVVLTVLFFCPDLWIPGMVLI